MQHAQHPGSIYDLSVTAKSKRIRRTVRLLIQQNVLNKTTTHVVSLVLGRLSRSALDTLVAKLKSAAQVVGYSESTRAAFRSASSSSGVRFLRSARSRLPPSDWLDDELQSCFDGCLVDGLLAPAPAATPLT